MQLLVRNANRRPDDPFVRLYLRLKAEHQGQRRWFGRARWKVAGKLIAVIFHCPRHHEPYDPDRPLKDMQTA